MKKKYILFFIATFLAIAGGIFYLNYLSRPVDNKLIFYYGKGCPHCANVEKYFDEGGVRKKISFLEKEVYYDKNNSLELQGKAQACGIPLNDVGVPFLWDSQNSKCLVGDVEIIDFFKQQLN
jgi:hypothetical protein